MHYYITEASELGWDTAAFQHLSARDITNDQPPNPLVLSLSKGRISHAIAGIHQPKPMVRQAHHERLSGLSSSRM